MARLAGLRILFPSDASGLPSYESAGGGPAELLVANAYGIFRCADGGRRWQTSRATGDTVPGYRPVGHAMPPPLLQSPANPDIATDEPECLADALQALVGAEHVTRPEDGFRVVGTFAGTSAKDRNRALISVLRRAVKRTRLRARRTGDGETERFLDHVSKGRRPTDG